MVKFLKPNKAVIVLQGRYAGRKAVIIRTFDDGTRDRPYGHCLVAGISKYPSKVIKKDSAKKTAKKSRVKAFVKLVNYQHLMPTRYTLDVDLKDVVTQDCLQSKDKKVTALKETKKNSERKSRAEQGQRASLANVSHAQGVDLCRGGGAKWHVENNATGASVHLKRRLPVCAKGKQSWARSERTQRTSSVAKQNATSTPPHHRYCKAVRRGEVQNTQRRREKTQGVLNDPPWSLFLLCTFREVPIFSSGI